MTSRLLCGAENDSTQGFTKWRSSFVLLLVTCWASAGPSESSPILAKMSVNYLSTSEEDTNHTFNEEQVKDPNVVCPLSLWCSLCQRRTEKHSYKKTWVLILASSLQTTFIYIWVERYELYHCIQSKVCIFWDILEYNRWVLWPTNGLNINDNANPG